MQDGIERLESSGLPALQLVARESKINIDNLCMTSDSSLIG